MEEGQLGIGEELLVELVDCSIVMVKRETLERWRELLGQKNRDLPGSVLMVLETEIDVLLK
jgi:hypothetical protein